MIDDDEICGRWWYDSGQNAAYTLGRGDLMDLRNIMTKIFANNWTTGLTMFEGVVVCGLEEYLGIYYVDAPGIYSIANGTEVLTEDPHYVDDANFGDDGLPSCGRSEKEGYWCFVMDIDLVFNLTAYEILEPPSSRNAKFNDQEVYVYHPQNTLYNIAAGGFDVSCTSQLNLTILKNVERHL